MSRTFAYCRVSTTEQTTENQILAIRTAGYDVPDHRVVSETVSGSVQAMKRRAFVALVDKLEAGDRLVVLKLDRLGRDNIDVQQTTNDLLSRGIAVISLDLPAPDLTSSAGKLILQLFAAFAEFERNRIRERTREGLERAKAEGKTLGRRVATGTTERVQALKSEGKTQAEIAAIMGVNERTVRRHWNP